MYDAQEIAQKEGNMDNAKDIIEKIHFTGKRKYTIDQSPEDEQFIKKLDEAIDASISRLEKKSGKPITITEGDRYELRWRLIKKMLIAQGTDPAKLDEMEAAVIAATDEAIDAREKFVNSFKVIK